METGAKKRIIIIADDKRLELQSNATLLRMCSYEPIPVLNGVPVVAEIKERIDEIDAVVLDWMMPDLSAEGVLNEVGELLKINNIPVFILSGLSPNISQEYMDATGIIQILEKPASLPTVKAALDNYFSNK